MICFALRNSTMDIMVLPAKICSGSSIRTSIPLRTVRESIPEIRTPANRHRQETMNRRLFPVSESGQSNDEAITARYTIALAREFVFDLIGQPPQEAFAEPAQAQSSQRPIQPEPALPARTWRRRPDVHPRRQLRNTAPETRPRSQRHHGDRNVPPAEAGRDHALPAIARPPLKDFEFREARFSSEREHAWIR